MNGNLNRRPCAWHISERATSGFLEGTIVIFVAYLAITRKDTKADRPLRVAPDVADPR
jgi:hypothetical protein